jgi:putative transposase
MEHPLKGVSSWYGTMFSLPQVLRLKVFILPAKNVIKQYIEGGFYHVYNRGVEKRTIFQDTQDYVVLLSYFKTTLSPPITSTKGVSFAKDTPLKNPAPPYNIKNHFGQIELLAYCLMPNHFHLLIRQQNPKSIASFMSSVFTRYSVYFNRKYNRTGKLFENRYKAILIENESYLLHLSRYIHSNPLPTNTIQQHPNRHQILANAFSSYADYLNSRNTSWIRKEIILSYFSSYQKNSKHSNENKLNYQDFVEANDEIVLPMKYILEV